MIRNYVDYSLQTAIANINNGFQDCLELERTDVMLSFYRDTMVFSVKRTFLERCYNKGIMFPTFLNTDPEYITESFGVYGVSLDNSKIVHRFGNARQSDKFEYKHSIFKVDTIIRRLQYAVRAKLYDTVENIKLADKFNQQDYIVIENSIREWYLNTIHILDTIDNKVKICSI